MKYALMFVNNVEDFEQWERTPTAEQKEIYDRIIRWFDEHSRAGQILRGGAELQGPHTATTIRFKGDHRIVTDGPFMEAKEVVGGSTIIDVPRSRRRDYARQELAGSVDRGNPPNCRSRRNRVTCTADTAHSRPGLGPASRQIPAPG